MTYQKARVIFATHMQAARSRNLTGYEKQQLNIARQVLRQSRKPISNRRITIKQAMQLAKEHGHRIVNNREWEEFIVKGPYFPTGYHTNDLQEAVDTLLFEIKRHQRVHGHVADAGNPNPRNVLIYGRVNRIIATKTQKHICDAECKRHGHRYYHDFTSKPKMYGLANGDILITTR